jgi:hypothetical protein
VRQYFSTTSSGETFKCVASRTTSSTLIHTNPGPPVQQLPHCVHVKRRPSEYQVAATAALGRTSSFIEARV